MQLSSIGMHHKSMILIDHSLSGTSSHSSRLEVADNLNQQLSFLVRIAAG